MGTMVSQAARSRFHTRGNAHALTRKHGRMTSQDVSLTVNGTGIAQAIENKVVVAAGAIIAPGALPSTTKLELVHSPA
jgi:hypothetical protein